MSLPMGLEWEESLGTTERQQRWYPVTLKTVCSKA